MENTLNKRTSPKQNPNTGSKDVLARCLATENISVEHSAGAATASFDTKSRVLTLPVWQDMTGDLYDMLVGHEVAHALWTPADEWAGQMDRFGAINRGLYMTFVNIVEDARIERMIKAKFPGLRRDFFNAYKDLADRDIFELGDREINTLPLIDRLNLEYKIGGFVPVSFGANEQQWVDALADTKTFMDVCDVAADLFEDAFPDWDKEEEEVEQDTPEAGEGDMPMPGSGDDEQEQDGPEGNSQMPAPSNEGDESEDGEGTSGAGEGDDSEDAEQGEGESTEAKGEGTMDGEDSTDDGSTAESNEVTGEGESKKQEGLRDDYTENQICRQIGGETQNAMDAGLQNMVDNFADHRYYIDLPTPNTDKIVTDHAEIHENIGTYINNDERRVNALAAASLEMRQFERESKKTINMMSQQFMMRQAADEFHRTSISQTGILDVNKMMNYKWSEDLFLRNEEIADGKNHGVVLFVDWSGSMCDIMEDTIKQMIQMVLFCKKVGIPFEVYSFTSHTKQDKIRYYDMTDEQRAEYDAIQHWTNQDDRTRGLNRFGLNNYLSSRMNARQMKRGLNHMMYLAKSFNWHRGHDGFDCPTGHDLGSTPLNEAIAAAIEIIPQFQKDNNLQIVNTMFLTDGCASGSLGGYGADYYLTDSKTKKTYRLTNRGTTAALLECFTDRTGSKAIGIYLDTRKSLRSGTEEMQAEYKKNGFCSSDQQGYTEYFIVRANQQIDNNGIEDLDADASYTRLKNAFMKQSAARVNSRVLLGRVVDLLAC